MSTRQDPPPSPVSGDDARPPARRRRGLDGRTVGICVCVALLAGLAAGLLYSVLSGGDDGDDMPRASLTKESDVDRSAALTTEVTTFDDEPTTVGAYVDGKPLVINLWASTCVPCITEMPAIEKVSKANPDIDFLGVDVQDQKPDAVEMLEKTGVTYPSVQDKSGSFARAANAAGLPTTLLVSPDGDVVATHLGALTESELQDLIDTKLR